MPRASYAPRDTISAYHAALLEVQRVCQASGWTYPEVMTAVLNRWLGDPTPPPPDSLSDAEEKRRHAAEDAIPTRAGTGRRLISVQELRERAELAAPNPGDRARASTLLGRGRVGRHCRKCSGVPLWILDEIREWPDFALSTEPCPGGKRWIITRTRVVACCGREPAP